jgi:hypothetical protein
MSTVNFSQKRKRLTIGLGAILALGSVLIATERMQKGNSSSSSGSRAGTVQGESAASDPALVQYRAMAQQSFAVIQDNFGQIEKGESSSGADLAQLQNNLLSAVVPAPYQDLHLRLVGLVMKMQARGGLDINLLQEQIRLLGRDYQWLANNENSQ